MPTSVRLDPETEAVLKRIAKRSGRSKSDVLREAVHRLADTPGAEAVAVSVHDLVADLVGIARNGPVNLARNHKQAYRAALAKKHAR
ncbi:MAG TPA: ribbon-helix-helix protein, CopG family [Gammaproteobacteria bacterium]|jgi:hypothetical protein|nr:ribbon-helix-helix protein, CopG family [Gammaproteobacteria bacterium]